MIILLVVINVIISMVINGCYINDYWGILEVINVIILMAIGGYFIGGYWRLLMLLY